MVGKPAALAVGSAAGSHSGGVGVGCKFSIGRAVELGLPQEQTFRIRQMPSANRFIIAISS